MSFLDDLRDAEAEAQANSRITIEVPRSKFAVRFGPHPGGRDGLTPYVAAYTRVGALTAEQELQLIVDCCREILRRDPDTGKLEGYEPEPLRFDAGDERWLGLGDERPTSARQCVERLYRLDEQPTAAAGTAEGLMGWMQGILDGTPGRVEGESDGSAT